MNSISSKFEWKFDKLKEIYKAAQFYIKTHLISNRFSNSDFPAVEWELILEIYKRETILNADDGTVGIWLRQIGPNTINDFVNTKYKIYAIKNTKRVDIGRSTNQLENQKQIGYSTFKLGDVINPKGESSNGTMIYEGSLHLYCEVELVCFNPIADLQNKFKKMLEEEAFTDCIFKVGDEIIKAHRCILVQNSEVFKKMFGENGMLETKNCEVTISDTTPECFRALLEYFYTGKIKKETLQNNVDGIFAIAHKYQVETLKFECERLMSNFIHPKTFLKYCGIISLYGAPTLEEACKDYCRANRSFLNGKEWEDVQEAYTNLAFKFIRFVLNDNDNTQQ
ncbi:hypothetical protein ACQ4LE_010845 [Meloidogyne hapla]|uniref:BTB domain-containing protein n=1 Tax=Meloidogyne hapla TaxID=6305 RepID=A0A1I8B109_MELHA